MSAGAGVVVAAGGTGGHLYPAFAVAAELKEMKPDMNIHFVGSISGIENRLVPREGFAFTPVASGPWRRGNPLSLVKGASLAFLGMLKARRLLRDTNAGVVFSTGGYASAPVLAAAAVSRMPTVLHEPNRVPGLVNRVFGRLASRVAVGFEAAASSFPRSVTEVTGIPVRRRILRRDRAAARDGLGIKGAACVVLVMGGSQGASAINRAVERALPGLSSGSVPVAVVWLCGARDRERCEAAAAGCGFQVRVFEYLDDIGDALAAADLVVSRSGTTVAELLAIGRPSILVPYPHAAGNHQLGNARELERHGAAVVLSEDELESSRLAEVISGLAADPFRRSEMSRRAAAQGRPAAARQVAEQILGVMRN